MAAVTGWADLAGGVGREPDVTAGMLAALAHRGSDHREIWQDERAGLGYSARRRAGASFQSAVISAGRGHPVAIAYDGSLYNLGELRRELAGRGRPAGASSEAECLLHAYLEWGRDFAGHLNGPFACALWDAGAGRLLLMRDRVGIKPLYYALTPDGVLFGSEPCALFAHPRFEPVVDIEGFRELLSRIREPAASIWRGVSEVPAATVLTIDGSGCSGHVYWQLRAEPMADDVDDAVAALRAAAGDALGCQLESGSPGCLLSGGLDSSAVAALAANWLAGRAAGPLRTYTVSFAGYVENFQPEFSRARPAPDAPFASEVASHIGSDHTIVELSAAELADPEVRRVIWTASDRLPLQPDLCRVLYLLCRGVSQRDGVVLSGDGPDVIFGRGLIDSSDDAPGTQNFDWLLWTYDVPRFSVLREELESQIDMAAHTDRLNQVALASIPRSQSDTSNDRWNRDLTYIGMTWEHCRDFERFDRVSNAAGTEIWYPYWDHRVIELAFNTSYRLHTLDGREKSLLRTAMASLLPASVVARHKSPLPTPQDAEYGRAIEQEYLELLARPDAPLFDLADQRKLRWLAKNIGGKTSALHLRRAREDVLALNGWLELHGSRLRL
jgi:asparagine synthase (glutamine-hydrolysing)